MIKLSFSALHFICHTFPALTLAYFLGRNVIIYGFQIRMTIVSSRSLVIHVQKICLFTISHKTRLAYILSEKKVCNTDQTNCKNSA